MADWIEVGLLLYAVILLRVIAHNLKTIGLLLNGRLPK